VTQRCLQCGRRPRPAEEIVDIIGGIVHRRCVVPPPVAAWRTSLPPPDRDLRLKRAERVRPYRAGVTPLGEWLRGVAGAQRPKEP
jgi:hypothetical protein